MKTEMFLGQIVAKNKLKSVIKDCIEKLEDRFSDCVVRDDLYDLDRVYVKLRGDGYDLSASDATDYINNMFRPKLGRIKRPDEVVSVVISK
jgi:uncharacterized protein (UPF0335 family)